MSKTREDYFNVLKGGAQVKALKQELKHKYLQICRQNYNDRDLIIDCMYQNLKMEENKIENFIFKMDAHAKFYEANKDSISQEELKAQRQYTKEIVADWMQWYDRIQQKQL